MEALSFRQLKYRNGLAQSGRDVSYKPTGASYLLYLVHTRPRNLFYWFATWSSSPLSDNTDSGCNTRGNLLLKLPLWQRPVVLASRGLKGSEMDSANTTGLPPIPTSQEINTTTLIVGSGICGLSTAYNLAKRQPKDGQTHRIIVIDALEDVFGAASSLNSGIVAYQWFTGDLRDIAEYSYRIYEQLAQADSTFKRTCGYHAHSISKLVPGRSSSPAQVPTWLNIPEAWHVEEDLGNGRAAAL